MAVGVLFSAKAFMQVMISPAILLVVDVHERLVFFFGLALGVVSTILLSTSTNFFIILFARCIQGAGSAALLAAGLGHLKNRFTQPQERAKAMGMAATGIVSGVCFGPVLGGFLYQIDAALPWVCTAVFETGVLILALMYFPTVQRETVLACPVSVTTLLRSRLILVPLGALAIANMAIGALTSTIAEYLHEEFGYEPTQVGLIFSFSTVPTTLTAGVSGWLGNRFGRVWCVSMGLLIQGLFTMLGPKSNLYVELVSLFVLGIGMGLIDGCCPALLGDIADAHFHKTSKVYVLSNVAIQVGFVLGPLLGGWLLQWQGFGVVSVVLGALLVVYTPFMSLLPANVAKAEPLLP